MSETLATQKRTALSRELSEFLVELSIGVHRYAMYPPEHPSLEPVVDNILARLDELFIERRSLSIGVAQRQLVIEGVATDQKHPVLSDLARRLHDHQLAAVSFSRGVRGSEVSELLQVLSEDTEREGTPVGLLPPDEMPRWEHAKLFRVGYDRLELSEGEGGGGGGSTDRVSALWLGLAQAALSMETAPDQAPGATEVARGIESRVGGRGGAGDAAYDQVIVGYLLQIADELKGQQGDESDQVRRRLSRLINELDDATLQRLVDFGGDRHQRQRFLLDANQSLAVDSVVKVLQAAASSRQQTISHSMTRLLNKLAVHASGGGSRRSQADNALRENVESLISGWELADPNPEAYTNVLDSMSRAAPLFRAPDDDGESLSGALRLVEMALEVDSYGPIVSKAVSDLVRDGAGREVLHLLRDAPAGNATRQAIREHLTSPAQFRQLLAAGNVGDEGLDDLLDEMGSGAVDPLLDLLADSDARTVRRRVYDALQRMGPFVGQRAVERMEDTRWFVLRNMLGLLARLDHLPEDFDPQPYLDHPDQRVRREAFPLAFRRPRLRDRTLVVALSDADERAVRMALLELHGGVPDPVLPTLVNRVLLPTTRSPEIRALGVKVLAGSRAHLALNALLEVATAGKTLFGRPKLAATSPESVAALHALALSWADHPEVAEVLEQAGRSRDPQVRGAVRITSGTAQAHRSDPSAEGDAG